LTVTFFGQTSCQFSKGFFAGIVGVLIYDDR